MLILGLVSPPAKHSDRGRLVPFALLALPVRSHSRTEDERPPLLATRLSLGVDSPLTCSHPGQLRSAATLLFPLSHAPSVRSKVTTLRGGRPSARQHPLCASPAAPTMPSSALFTSAAQEPGCRLLRAHSLCPAHVLRRVTTALLRRGSSSRPRSHNPAAVHHWTHGLP